MNHHRPTTAKSFRCSWGMLFASLGAIACSGGSPVIYDNWVTTRAVVYGQVGGGNPPATGWRVSIVVYSNRCGDGRVWEKEVAVDTSGFYMAYPELPLQPTGRCITATLLPSIGADTTRKSGSVYFSDRPASGAPRDSLRLDLRPTAP